MIEPTTQASMPTGSRHVLLAIIRCAWRIAVMVVCAVPAFAAAGDPLKLRNPATALEVVSSLYAVASTPDARKNLDLCAAELRVLAAKADSWAGQNISAQDQAAWAARFDQVSRAALIADPKLCPFNKIIFMKRQRCISSHYYTEHIDGSFVPGGTICILDLKTGKVNEAVTGLVNGVFGRYDLSFDAKQVVFAWKLTRDEGFRIYESNVDGSGLRQLTFAPTNEADIVRTYRNGYHHGTDDMDPCYLPDGGICFVSTRCMYGTLCDSPDVFTTTVLYRMDGNGSNMVKLTNSSVNEFTPAVANDGRILYNRWEYVDKGAVSVKCIWSMKPDGSSSAEVYGNDIALPPTMIQPRAIEGSNNKYVILGVPHFSQNSVGTVIRLDMTKNIRTREPMAYMTPDVDVRGEGGYWWDNQYGGGERLFTDPYPLSEKFFLVSEATGGWDAYRSRTLWGLYLLDEKGRLLHLYDDHPQIGCFQPMPLRARTKPPVLPAMRDEALAKKNKALCIVTDVYRGMEGVQRGEVKYLRINEQAPRPWAARRRYEGDLYDQQHACITKDTHLGLKVQHGIVPVEEDGSAQFLVTADRNIFIQALDEHFMELQRERTYVNYRPGETRACVGCHERPNDTPQLAGGSPMALRRPLSEPGPQPGEISGARPLYYAADVQPVLDKNCVACHRGPKPKGDLDLSGTMTELFSVSYEKLLPERRGGQGRRGPDLIGPTIGENHPKTGNIEYMPPKTFGSHASVIVAMLYPEWVQLKNPALAALAEKLGPTHAKVKLSEAERVRLTTWIDSNGQYYGSWWGRRNSKYKDHPNFRPVPTFDQAVSTVPPVAEDKQ